MPQTSVKELLSEGHEEILARGEKEIIEAARQIRKKRVALISERKIIFRLGNFCGLLLRHLAVCRIPRINLKDYLILDLMFYGHAKTSFQTIRFTVMNAGSKLKKRLEPNLRFFSGRAGKM